MLFIFLTIIVICNNIAIGGYYYAKGTNAQKIQIFNDNSDIKLPNSANIEKYMLLKQITAKEGFLYLKVFIPSNDLNIILSKFNFDSQKELKGNEVSNDGNYIIESVDEFDAFYNNSNIWHNEYHYPLKYTFLSQKSKLKIYITQEIDGQIILFIEKPVDGHVLSELQKTYVFRKWF